MLLLLDRVLELLELSDIMFSSLVLPLVFAASLLKQFCIVYDGYKHHLRLQDFIDLAFHEFDGEASLFSIFVYHFLENVISEYHGNSSYMTKPYPQQTNLSHNVNNSLYVCSYHVHSMHNATNFVVLDLPLLEIVSFATNDNCTHDQNTSVPFYYLENQQANKKLHFQCIVQLIV